MERVRLPIGIENFEEIRTQDYYYVDKTLLIRDLLTGGAKVSLFTRPRRFGKTLNMSMLKYFFQIGGDPSLFDGLAIAKEQKLRDEYEGKFPVVFVSLKDVDGLSFDVASSMLQRIIQTEAFRFAFLLESDRLLENEKNELKALYDGTPDAKYIRNSLRLLSELLYKHYGQKAVLLIDEYDVPLDKAYHHGYYNEMIDLVRALFNAALKTNDSLQLAVMTGCLRVSKESIFTGLNNLIVHAISDTQFDEFFGFTDDEVAQMLAYYQLESHHAEAKKWYDGYRFGEQDVYCPWDVINYCYALRASDKAEPQTYWLNTSGNDMVRRLIDKAGDGTTQMEIERLIEGESIAKALNDRLTHNEIDANIDNIWSLLYMTGYLTTTAMPSKGVYQLVIPNYEVRQIYIDQVRSWFKDRSRAAADTLGDLYQAFETGDVQTLKRILDEQLLDTISFYDAQESFYHGFLLALMGACTDWYVSSNIETGRGRSDIKVERRDRKRGIIVEVKDVKDENKMEAACEAAIRQIEEKDYASSLRRYRIKDIWLYGIAFCDKECRVLAVHLT